MEPVVVSTERNVWGADRLQDIIDRNAKWMQEFVVAAVVSLRKDGRPLYTAKVDAKERIAKLLEAGPEFWDALQQNNPEVAAAMLADIIRARAAGKIPPTGPRAQEASEMPDDWEEDETGTQPAQPLPEFTDNPEGTLV